MKVDDSSTRTMRISIRSDCSMDASGQDQAQSAQGAFRSSRSGTRGERRATEYRKLLQSIYDGVLITDYDGQVVDSNSRAADFFRCSNDDLAKTNAMALISGADANLLSAILKNLEDHRYTLIEGKCVRSDASMFPAEIAVNRVDLDRRAQLCFFVRDISVRKRAQDALEDAVARLEAHDRARTQFVSNVSHELRTPLTSMIYAVSNMLKGVVGPLPDRVRRYLDMIQADCRRLLGTVNDILDINRIETQSLVLDKTRVPFERLVRSSVDSLKLQADQKSLALGVSTDGSKYFVLCDAQKMERVVFNVLGNAIKFTPSGGSVHVSMRQDPAGKGRRLHLAIRDTGIGIPADAIDKVTLRYFTVGEQPSGSGLGLAIAKEIVEMHGGCLQINSPPPDGDRGTVVNIYLPTADPPSVLIVDDDDAVLDLLESQIAGEGYQVVRANDGIDAFEKVRKNRPDVVILDLVLPKLVGSELILKMKSDKALRPIPVIVLTGAQIGEAKAEILKSFAIPLLHKPWTDVVLMDRVAGALLGTFWTGIRPAGGMDSAGLKENVAPPSNPRA